MYDIIGVLIALTILVRVRRDGYSSIGALLGFVTYTLAIVGHFLFYRYQQENLYFSDFFQAPAAEEVFRFIVIVAVLTWIFNIMALIMCYVEVFNLRGALRPRQRRAKAHKTPHVTQTTSEQHVAMTDTKEHSTSIPSTKEHTVKTGIAHSTATQHMTKAEGTKATSHHKVAEAKATEHKHTAEHAKTEQKRTAEHATTEHKHKTDASHDKNPDIRSNEDTKATKRQQTVQTEVLEPEVLEVHGVKEPHKTTRRRRTHEEHETAVEKVVVEPKDPIALEHQKTEDSRSAAQRKKLEESRQETARRKREAHEEALRRQAEKVADYKNISPNASVGVAAAGASMAGAVTDKIGHRGSKHAQHEHAEPQDEQDYKNIVQERKNNHHTEDERRNEVHAHLTEVTQGSDGKSAIVIEPYDHDDEVHDTHRKIRVRADQLDEDQPTRRRSESVFDEPIDVIIEGVNLSQIGLTAEQDDINVEPAHRVTSEKKASRKRTETKRQRVEDTSVSNNRVEDTQIGDTLEQTRANEGYVAQLTGDLFMDDDIIPKKTRRAKTSADKTATRAEARNKTRIKRDIGDDLDDDE